jgi:hypothetical protein
MIARLPLISASQLARSLGQQTLLYRRLARARGHGLVAIGGRQARTGGRPADLLRITPAGRKLLAAAPTSDERVQSRSNHRDTPHQLATLLACYELLSELAEAVDSSARVVGWEQPWQRTYRPAPGRGKHHVRLPAAVTLAWSRPDEERSQSYLLLPDLGGIHLPAWRPRLRHLARLQHAYGERLPALAILTTTEARALAWRQTLVEATTATNSDWPLEGWTIRIARRSVGLAVLNPGNVRARPRRARGLDAPLAGPDLDVLDTVGRHPFLTTALLATLLGRHHDSMRRSVKRLLELHLLRIVPSAERCHDVESNRPLELTSSGLTAVAACLGLPPATAARVHGLTGGGPGAASGPREMLLAHATHTLTADRVMVGLAAAARADRRGGCLIEWRNAAACAHGRLRPDGYGLLRLASHECGFFLELDRATMRPSELRVKFVAYHRFRASRRAVQVYTSFPTILVVTTGPGAEHRLATAVRAVDPGFASPLPVLLTTTAWIDAHPRGMLGPIWRQPQARTRLCWPRLTHGGVPHAC